MAAAEMVVQDSYGNSAGSAGAAATPARQKVALGTEVILAARKADAVTDSAAGRVARLVAMDILTGRLPSGDKLPAEEVLLDRFGISRTVLREAVKTLTAKGMLHSRRRVGTVVRDRQHWNFFDAEVLAWRIDVGLDMALLNTLREARLAVEPFAASLAAQRASGDDLARMAESVRGMRAAIGDRRRFAQADLQFHRAVATASGNFILGSFSSVIETALVCSTLLLPLEDAALHHDAVACHEELLAAIAARDPDEACRQMTEMIRFGARVGEALS